MASPLSSCWWPRWRLPLEFWSSILPTKSGCICILCVGVTQSCPALYDRTDCSPPGSSVRGALQARILECVAIPFSWGSSQPRDRTQVSCTAGRFFTVWATREAHICSLRMVKYLSNNLKQSWAHRVDGHFLAEEELYFIIRMSTLTSPSHYT